MSSPAKSKEHLRVIKGRVGDSADAPMSLWKICVVILWTPMVLLFGLSTIFCSPLYMAMTAFTTGGRLLFFKIITRTVVPFLAGFMDTVPTWLMMIWWLPDYYNSHIAQDGKPVLQGIAVGELHRYGETHIRETVQALTPFGAEDSCLTDRHEAPSAEDDADAHKHWFSKAGPRHVLYIHGGGFLAANAVLLMPSITPLVRKGYTVWCINYPLAPKSQHPVAVLSVLRALNWLRQERNVYQVSIVGDSAGGQLATTAAALVANPNLLSELAESIAQHPELPFEGPDPHWQFPNVMGVVSLYGVLDFESWTPKDKRLSDLTWLENKLAQFALELCTWSYCNDRVSGGAASVPTGSKVLFCDFVESLDHYPPSLFICGELDILVHSSRLASDSLTAKGFDTDMKVYAGARHAFVVLYFGSDCWKRISAVATNDAIAFLDRCRMNHMKKRS